MYKIYCNEHLLVLADHLPESAGDWTLVSRYRGKPKTFFPFLDAFEKRSGREQVWLYHEDLDRLWSDFRQLFTVVEAGGGLVRNPAGEILVIYRKGVLDLPKGKQEPGEGMKETAIREVMEETGLTHVVCGDYLGETWHLFKEKKRRFLKHTDWFLMAAEQQHVVPQKEEGIEEVTWMSPETYLNAEKQTFRNIRDMVRDIFSN